MQSDLDRYLREDLRAVLNLVQGTNVRELELQDGDIRLWLRRTPAPVELAGMNATPSETAVDATPLARTLEDNGMATITAPMVGRFYHSEQPSGEPLVAEGSEIEPGTIIGVIEALQVMTEVEAGCHGRVERVIASDGEPVEYGQILVEVRVADRS